MAVRRFVSCGLGAAAAAFARPELFDGTLFPAGSATALCESNWREGGEALKVYLDKRRGNLNRTSLLFEAQDDEWTEVIRLAGLGRDVNEQDAHSGVTALHLAAAQGRRKVVEQVRTIPSSSSSSSSSSSLSLCLPSTNEEGCSSSLSTAEQCFCRMPRTAAPLFRGQC
jgi:hypothetical protein